MNSEQVQEMNDGLLAGMVARGEGIDIMGDVVGMDEKEMAKFLDVPTELWRMKVGADGWTVSAPEARVFDDGRVAVWGMVRPMAPGMDLLVLADPNFPCFVELFQPMAAGKQQPLGKAILLGWNEEVHEVVVPVHEVKEWLAVADAPKNAELWVRDIHGRFGICLHEENGGWWSVVGDVKEPSAWAWLGELSEEKETVRVLGHGREAFLAQKSPSEASDGVQVGEERGQGVQGASTPARSSAANGSGGEAV